MAALRIHTNTIVIYKIDKRTLVDFLPGVLMSLSAVIPDKSYGPTKTPFT